MRTRRAALAIVVLILGSGVLGASTALAESPVLLDCAHTGKLSRHYSVAELNNALQTMPPTFAEYNSECYDLIESQLHKELGTSTSTGTGTTAVATSGGSGPPIAIIALVGVIVLVGIGFAVSARRHSDGAS